jgi:hypothetical protein
VLILVVIAYASHLRRGCDEVERVKISYKYGIINMKNIACEELLYHHSPSAVALSILCDFEGKDKQIVVNTILKRIKELTDGDEIRYKNYLKKVNILSTNRDLEKEVEKGAKMLSVNVDMEIIHKTTGLSLNRIGKLKEKMQKESV